MARAGLQPGDFVTISGGRATVARVLPAYPEYRGRELMQIDGITRQNSQLALDQRGRLTPAIVQPAREVTMTLTGEADQPEPSATQIARLLVGMPLVAGDWVRATFFRSATELQVSETEPAGPVFVEQSTQIRIQRNQARGPSQAAESYEDIGGLAPEVRRVREMVELPLKYPGVFAHLGIDPPRGVLLHGPPGTGKTLIARTVAHETKAFFIHVDGPEIIRKYYGESEARLREIFETARANAPSIIFLDEVDAIAPHREEVVGEVEKRVVAQLLASMDGLEPRGQVVVIGATNIPNALDPAIRRPGRFDREIAIGIPDQKGRLEILQIHTRGMPLAADVDLDDISQVTHGFVGADLAALCKEAAMVALREALPRLEPKSVAPTELVEHLRVNQRHFLQALTDVEPSAIREVLVEVPAVTWDDIGGLGNVKQQLRETIEWPLRWPDLIRQVGAMPPRGILLVGPPGTGKTLLARAVASASQVNFISVKGPELFSKWVGESEKAVRQVFHRARQAAPCVIFFDEIDALAVRRDSGNDDAGDKVLGQLLTEMDGIEGIRGIVVLAATNRPDRLDPALLRPGRFDLILTLGQPDCQARQAIIAIHTANRPLAADVDIARLAAETDGLSGADIEHVCRQAAWIALRRHLAMHPSGDVASALLISSDDFHEAIETAVTRRWPR